jgi:hypothetical protein
VVVHSLTFSLGRGDTCAAFLSLAAGYCAVAKRDGKQPAKANAEPVGRPAGWAQVLARGLPRPYRRFGARTSLAGNF